MHRFICNFNYARRGHFSMLLFIKPFYVYFPRFLQVTPPPSHPQQRRFIPFTPASSASHLRYLPLPLALLVSRFGSYVYLIPRFHRPSLGNPRRRHQQTSWLYRESGLDYESRLEAGRLAHRCRREVPLSFLPSFLPSPRVFLLTCRPRSFAPFFTPRPPFLLVRLCPSLNLRNDGEHTNTGSRLVSLVVFACEINAFLFRSELNASLHKETAIYSFILWGWIGRGRKAATEGNDEPHREPSVHPNRVLQTPSQSKRTAQSFLSSSFSPIASFFFPSVSISRKGERNRQRRGREEGGGRGKVKRLEGADVRHLPAFISFYSGHPPRQRTGDDQTTTL